MNETATLHCPIKNVVLETSHGDIAKDLAPLIERIKSNSAIEFNLSFSKGTLTTDGRLDLCKQSLGPAGCRILTNSLIENRTVVSLLLGTNGIGDEGARDVAKLIKDNNTIKIAYLGCNYIGHDGVAALAEAVSSSYIVTGLWLKRNPIGDEELVYAQLIKVKEKGRLVALKEKVIFGTEKLLETGLKISTSLIERVNETFRHALAPLVRKTRSFCKDRELMRKRVSFWTCYYNFARPHQSLRELIPEQERNRKGLIEQKYRQRTPGMAARLTDHVLTFRELLTVKFEPIHYQSISG